ncbi:Uncharacterised protein [uncultured archaeon]|nr:Uncharacterised protein [uncultured archaeon]
MELSLELGKTVRQNLQERYAELRKLKEKKAGLLAAMKETEKELREEEKKKEEKEKNAAGPSDKSASPHASPKSLLHAPPRAAQKSKKPKSHWYDPYLTFLTSGGRRVVAGRDAKQNDELYAKHLMTGDLFFHADIQGAPATIMKDGQKASEQERKEAAQWAASYSSAWKTGVSAVDVYALKPDQVSKHADGGYVGRGAFVLSGEREWFRKTELKLKVGWSEEGRMGGGELAGLPAVHPLALENQIVLSPGPVVKEEAAKKIAGMLSAKADAVSRLLPGGKFVIQ